jgi:hypothetical protein
VQMSTTPNSIVLRFQYTTCVKDGLITEKSVVEVPCVFITLFQHKHDRLDSFTFIMWLYVS